MHSPRENSFDIPGTQHQSRKVLMRKHGLTFTELLTVIALVGILASILLPAVARSLEAERRQSCANNLKQIGRAFRMYAAEANEQKFPPAANDSTPNNRADDANYPDASPSGVALYPEFITDVGVFFCPSATADAENFVSCPDGEWCNPITGQLDPDYFGRATYLYYGWCAFTPEEWLVIGSAAKGLSDANEMPYPANIAWIDEDFVWTDVRDTVMAEMHDTLSKRGFPDIVPTGNAGGDTIYRIRKGIERLFTTEMNDPANAAKVESELPVMWDHIELGLPYIAVRLKRFNHIPDGNNVLYMDGHVEWLRFPAAKHPCTKMNACGALL
jgi:prepilin-type N-terminal cleavage/methylation domain-containing protein/prepilin-type processing-associated H-X9-DG protein